METKNIVYLAVIAVSIIFALSLLLIYYTQSFDETLTFKQSVSHLDLEITEAMRGNVAYLVSAKGELGTLTLQNEGVFSQVYAFPNLVGCINLRSNANAEQQQIGNYQFAIRFMQNGASYYPGSKIEIPVGRTSTYQLIGEYASYNVPLYAFDGGIIDSVSIYRVELDEYNPLYTDDYYYDYRAFQYDNCNTFPDYFEPVVVIDFG